MATYKWEFGAEGSGFYFTIEFDQEAGTFKVTSHEGSFDLNALWFSDGDTTVDGDTKLSKQDNSLNMNGSTTVWDEDGNATSEKVVWDDYAKVSSPGLGSEGEDKKSFISDEDAEPTTFTLAELGMTGFDPVGMTLGVRATSVSGWEGGDSIKFADSTPELVPPPGNEPDDHFPEWTEPGLSHVTFYFQTGTDPYFVGDDSGIVGDKGANDPDGWYTVKFDEGFDVNGDKVELSDDLDDWLADALAYIESQNPDLDITTLAGVSIKGGTEEIWYDLDNDPNDVDTPPDVWIVENKEVDDTYLVTSADPFEVG
jgi:hypothetical protein